MKRAALGAALVAVVNAGAPVPAAVAARQDSRAPIVIRFELTMRHVIVNVRVSKSRPLSFVFDTGADRAIIRTDVAKELGLSLEGAVDVGGAGPGTQAGRRVKNATWSLVGHEAFAQPVALALPLPRLSTSLGRDVDGIIGGEFIRQFVLEMDYQARTLTLHDRDRFRYSGRGETLPIEFTPGNNPVVTARVTRRGGEPLERRFMLDTGSGAALILHSPFVAEQHLPGDQATVRAIGGAGAGGTTAGRIGRVASLQIGSFTISDPLTLFSEDKAGSFANPALAGNIGGQIASRFRLFLDYGRKRLILEPSPTFAEPFDRAFSGIAVRAEGPDYHTFRVHEVLEQSSATDAGIREGDVITAIDGKPADALTLSTINEMLETPVAYVLTIRRAQQILTVTLTPRKLV
jgi:aspartyl protease/PDZ domain-containing protein